MGVQGLWSILHCSGRNIDLSQLEGKKLAIDLSIWLNQALKSSNDSPNAHLELLFRRICKLLFFKIKPIFVFDGPTPAIKKHAIENRRRLRRMRCDRAEEVKSTVLNLLLKKNVIQKNKKDDKKSSVKPNIFELPKNFEFNMPDEPELYHFNDLAEEYMNSFTSIDTIDLESDSFVSLPLETQHEIIRRIATDKRYGYSNKDQDNLYKKNSEDFSSLQINRLLERNKLQQKVDNLQAAMTYRDNCNLLTSTNLFGSSGFLAENVKSKRIMSQENGFILLIDPHNEGVQHKLVESKEESSLADNSINSNEEETKLSQKELDLVMESASKLIKQVDNHKDISILTNTEAVCIHSVEKSEFRLEKLEGSFEDNRKQNFLSKNLSLDLNDQCLNVSMDYVVHLEPTEYEGINRINKDSDNNDDNCDGDNDDDDDDDDDDDNFIDVLTDNDDFVAPASEKNDSSSEFDDHSFRDRLDNADFVVSNKEDHNDLLIGQPFSEDDLRAIRKDPDSWLSQIDKDIEKQQIEELKLESQATTMNQQYYQEAKDLLKLFGMPYVESPGEAEAQCAFLEKAKLVDGTITEDSDIWLFGGQNVYKHVFTQNLSVRAYNGREIYKKLGLSRDLMISMALLSGSDYTAGVYGIGPVIAMEILAEFSDRKHFQTNFEVLQTFKTWYDTYKTAPDQCKVEHRKRYLRFNVDTNFPESEVIDAYTSPIVDESLEPFAWSPPAIKKLIEFGINKLGWTKSKVIEMLDLTMNKAETRNKIQTSILDYFAEPSLDELDSKRSPSKRLKLATEQRNVIVKRMKK